MLDLKYAPINLVTWLDLCFHKAKQLFHQTNVRVFCTNDFDRRLISNVQSSCHKNSLIYISHFLFYASHIRIRHIEISEHNGLLGRQKPRGTRSTLQSNLMYSSTSKRQKELFMMLQRSSWLPWNAMYVLTKFQFWQEATGRCFNIQLHLAVIIQNRFPKILKVLPMQIFSKPT